MPTASSSPSPSPGVPLRPGAVSGRVVVFSVLAIGLSLVLGVGTFAALTRPPAPPHAPSAAASGSATVQAPMHGGW